MALYSVCCYIPDVVSFLFLVFPVTWGVVEVCNPCEMTISLYFDSQMSRFENTYYLDMKTNHPHYAVWQTWGMGAACNQTWPLWVLSQIQGTGEVCNLDVTQRLLPLVSQVTEEVGVCNPDMKAGACSPDMKVISPCFVLTVAFFDVYQIPCPHLDLSLLIYLLALVSFFGCLLLGVLHHSHPPARLHLLHRWILYLHSHRTCHFELKALPFPLHNPTPENHDSDRSFHPNHSLTYKSLNSGVWRIYLYLSLTEDPHVKYFVMKSLRYSSSLEDLIRSYHSRSWQGWLWVNQDPAHGDRLFYLQRWLLM